MKANKSFSIVTSLGDTIEITNGLHYVTASDKFMSGWGRAENKTAKRIVVCKTWRQAQRMADAMKNNPHSYMKYVNIRSSFPRYSDSSYICSFSTYEDFNNDNWMKWTNIPE